MGTEVQVIMEFQASKTPQMRETLRFRDTTRPSQFLDLIFVAKVMSMTLTVFFPFNCD